MLSRSPAERPERILQTLRQRHKALAAEHDMRMFPARKGQPEMIEPVVEWHAGDTDATIVHVGKIGQTKPARRVLLAEDDLALGAMQRSPGADAPLQSAPDAGTVGSRRRWRPAASSA